jgi:hypothetical protein
MPLDPLLINGIRPVNVEPYGAAAARALTLGSMAGQNAAQAQERQANAMKLADLERGRKLADQQSRFVIENTDANGVTNHRAVGQSLINNGYGTEGAAYLAQVTAAEIAQKKEKIAQASAMSKAAANLLQNVELAPVEQRPSILSQARARWAAMGYPADALPEVYSPEAIAAAMVEGRDADKHIAQMQKDVEIEETRNNNVRTDATKRRGDDMTAATAAAGQKVTADGNVLRADVDREGHRVTARGQDVAASTARRGQDISAVTAREGHAITREGNQLQSENKQPTADESKNWAFYTRATQAEQALNSLDAAMKDKSYAGQVYQKHAPGFMQTSNNQSYDQGKRQFVAAYLRRDSGAVISPSEFDDADKTFFPQPGEDATVQEQKRQARLLVIETLKKGAGRAYTKNGEYQPAADPIKFIKTATGPGGQRIGSNDGETWFDVRTGKKVQ